MKETATTVRINAFGNRGRSRKIKNVEMAVADETAMDAEPPRSSTESSPSYYQESSEFREQTYSSSRFKRKLSPLVSKIINEVKALFSLLYIFAMFPSSFCFQLNDTLTVVRVVCHVLF